MAVVLLHVIDAPFGERGRVELLEPLAARLAGTGEWTGAGVDAELQAPAVELSRQPGDTVGETCSVGLQAPVRVPPALSAIVEAEVNVASLAEPSSQHGVRGREDDLLA